MMTAKLAPAALLWAWGLATMAGAQHAGPAPPAEMPPVAYAGTEYVDSRGCAYVRAGIDGTVTWVPRVTRQRRQVCGLEPTFATAAPAAPPSPRATEEVEPVPVPVRATDLPAQTRVVPRHLAEARARSGAFSVPRGYRPAWEDDRLNPRRAEGTLEGRDAMHLVWTETVPRRLVERTSAGTVKVSRRSPGAVASGPEIGR